MDEAAIRRLESENFNGTFAAYKRLLALADAEEIGNMRRVARDLTHLCREGIIGIACAENEDWIRRFKHSDESIELVKMICIEENELH